MDSIPMGGSYYNPKTMLIPARILIIVKKNLKYIQNKSIKDERLECTLNRMCTGFKLFNYIKLFQKSWNTPTIGKKPH